jgi:hypothetical protein
MIAYVPSLLHLKIGIESVVAYYEMLGLTRNCVQKGWS